MQGWLRKKTKHLNEFYNDLYPLRYLKLNRDTGEIQIFKEGGKNPS